MELFVDVWAEEEGQTGLDEVGYVSDAHSLSPYRDVPIVHVEPANHSVQSSWSKSRRESCH
jgi:hypothetical protein